MKINKYKRGQVWWYVTNTNFDGSVQGKTRPVIIMSNDFANAYSNCLLAIPCTTVEKKTMPTHTVFEIDSIKNTALAENMLSINKNKLTEYIGTCDDELLRKLENSLAIAVGLPHNKFYSYKTIENTNKSLLQNDVTHKNTDTDNNIKTVVHKSCKNHRFNLEDKIRFVNDYENHTTEYMLKKYNIKDKRGLQQKVYMCRKQIKENEKK